MGNELFFEGKKYISSRRASQITGYNSDYIGQLCRKGSLECRLVGRSWFVEEKSLDEHRVEASKTPRGRIPIYSGRKDGALEIKKTESREQGSVQDSGIGSGVDSGTALGTDSYATPSESDNAPHPYEHTPFLIVPSENGGQAQFARKIATVSMVILLCVLSVPFLARENHIGQIDIALRAGGKISKEINVNTSKQIASVMSFSLDGDAIRELRIKTQMLTLKTYHVVSLLPSMLFDTARNMKKIVMRESGIFSDGSDEGGGGSDGGSGGEKRGEGVTGEEKISRQSAEKETRAGVTVVPSSGDPAQDEKLKQYIKDSFSDETEVMPDETGTSGVIKPIFKKQNDQDYLYVIVPVKE